MNVLSDLYPSRVQDTPSITERKDPVVYTNPTLSNQKPLRYEQLAFFEKNGYLFFENFFGQNEIQAMKAELDALWSANRDSQAPEVIHEPDSDEIRSIFAVHRANVLFKKLSRDPRITNIVRQILASEVYIHQSRINFKPGFRGKEFYWHSDFETWHVEDGMPRMRALSCSIALSDNYEYNGPLMIIPGSHKHYVSCVGTTPQNHYRQSLRRQEYGVPDPENLTWLVKYGGIVAPAGAAGSMILFDCNVMHGSCSNITPYPRSNVFIVYNSIENTLVDPFSGLPPRPDYIAARTFEKI